MGVIFRVLSGGGESRALSITILWVQSPALSGNGCLSATWVLWAPHIPRKVRSVCRAWRWKKTPGRGDMDPILREQRKSILLRELSSERQGTTLFSRNPRPHPWGLPVCGEKSSSFTGEPQSERGGTILVEPLSEEFQEHSDREIQGNKPGSVWRGNNRNKRTPLLQRPWEDTRQVLTLEMERAAGGLVRTAILPGVKA